MFEEYEPTEIDIAWTKSMLSLVNDGGVMVFPSTRLIYRISHRHNTVILLNPEILDLPTSAKTHRRAIRVFEKLGWSVVVMEP